MNFPEDLMYSKEHEWVKLEGDTATIGITEFAQDELGDIVYVETPKVGSQVKQNETFGVVESVKTVSDLFSPVTGEVIEINEEVTNSPELINKSAYTEGWIIKVKLSNPAEMDSLLNVDDYKTMIGK